MLGGYFMHFVLPGLPKSIAGYMLTSVYISITSQIAIETFIKTISTDCCQIFSTVSQLSNGSWF
jgi:hypothetical protein